MLLDRGIAHVYRVDGTQRGDDITKGLPEVYRNWFGSRDHTAEDNATGDLTMRIRIPRADVLPWDIVTLGGTPWAVSRAYDGVDEDNDQEITDLTLIRGDNVFILSTAYPRKETIDDYNARYGVPDKDNASTLWCMRREVEDNVYYNSQQAGVTLDARADVYTTEYAGQSYLAIGSTTYRVERRVLHGALTQLYLTAIDGLEDADNG